MGHAVPAVEFALASAGGCALLGRAGSRRWFAALRRRS
jgi:hypothetical protein